ncbi:MAG TPA: TonB-dependent receptor [Sphingobacteriaceae bacterium]|nr:TonB-dependent receptor [Sphingobacteriaceae bacterium]
MMFKKIGIFSLLYLISLISYSQTRDTTNQSLKEVIIRDNRIELPFSQQNRNIQIIDQQLIKNLPVRSIQELLSYISGVDVRQRGPGGLQADISMDGGTFDQTLVLINGVKVSDPQTGHNMMNIPISPDNIDHIEVMRGSSARIYGINALSGAINIVTKTPNRTGVSANLFTGSSFNQDVSNGKTFASYGVRAMGNLSAGANTNHSLSLSRETGNGYRYNTAFKNHKAFYEGKFNSKNRNELSVMAGIVDNDFGANAFYAAPGDKEAQEIVQTSLAAISYKTSVNPNWIITPRVSYRYNEDDYRYIRTNLSKFRNQHKTHVINAEVNNRFNTPIGAFGLGLEGRKEQINSTNLGKRERDNFGVFGEYKFEKVKDLLVNIGSYVNYNSDFGYQIFPGFDAGYTFSSNWKLFTHIGTGQRLPTYTDLYYKGPTNIGNPDLQPETSLYGEAGIKYITGSTFVTASYFHRKVDNFIDWVKTTVTDPWQPQNFHQTNTNGYTLSANHRLTNSNSRSPQINAGVSYTHLDPEVKVLENKISRYVLQSLRNQLAANVNMKFNHAFSFTVGSRYCQRISYKDYTLLDARVSYERPLYNLYLDASNMLEADYIEAGAVPMPGRWYTLGARFNVFK